MGESPAYTFRIFSIFSRVSFILSLQTGDLEPSERPEVMSRPELGRAQRRRELQFGDATNVADGILPGGPV
jgi:hypothetical protein